MFVHKYGPVLQLRRLSLCPSDNEELFFIKAVIFSRKCGCCVSRGVIHETVVLLTELITQIGQGAEVWSVSHSSELIDWLTLETSAF